MKSLSEQLAETAAQAKERVPADALAVMLKATQNLKTAGIEGGVIQTGEQAPSFTLKNHLNEDRNLEAMLADGPLVVSFYRGGW